MGKKACPPWGKCMLIMDEKDAVQAANFINSTLTHPVHPQTVRNALKAAGFYSATKKKVPMLKLAHHKR